MLDVLHGVRVVVFVEVGALIVWAGMCRTVIVEVSIIKRIGGASLIAAVAAATTPSVARSPIAAPMLVMVVVGLVGIISVAIRIPRRVFRRVGVFRVWIGRLRAESDGLIVRRLSEKVLRMRERVGYSAGTSRGEVPRDRRRPWRIVLDLDVAAAMPCAGQEVRVAAHRKVDAFSPGVEVVDAWRRRHRVWEVDVAESVVGRQHAKGEIRRVKGDFQQFVAPEVDGVCLPLHELDEKRRCRIGRGGPQLRRRDERHDLVSDDEVARPRAGYGHLEDGHALRRLRVCENAVCRAGVENVLKDGVRRSFWI